MTRRARTAALLALLGVLGAFGPASVAGAQSARSHAGRIGGRVPDLAGARSPARHRVAATRDTTGGLQYGGGPVLHHNRTHVIFWAPAGSGLSYEPGYEALVERFLAAVAADSHSASNVYGLSGQYTDRGGPAAYASTYGGATQAADVLPPNGCNEPGNSGPGWAVCLTDAQLQSEITHVVSAAHLPRTAADVYFLVLPNGLGNCTDAGSSSCALGGGASGYCGYHSETQGRILYGVIPYNAVPGHCQSDNPRPNVNPADPALSSLSHEHNEVVTDPNASSGWIDAAGNENGDLCITQFGPVIGGTGKTAWNEAIGGGHWFLQEEWSNENGGCAARDEPDVVSVSAPARALARQSVGFLARARDPDGAISGYRWYFGDGGTSTRRSAGHAYIRRGTYRVVLRVVDNAANWTLYSRTVRVTGAGAPTRAPLRRR